jgi:hypothetical protein
VTQMTPLPIYPANSRGRAGIARADCRRRTSTGTPGHVPPCTSMSLHAVTNAFFLEPCEGDDSGAPSVQIERPALPDEVGAERIAQRSLLRHPGLAKAIVHPLVGLDVARIAVL